jgi:hypothetical protein
MALASGGKNLPTARLSDKQNRTAVGTGRALSAQLNIRLSDGGTYFRLLSGNWRWVSHSAQSALFAPLQLQNLQQIPQIGSIGEFSSVVFVAFVAIGRYEKGFSILFIIILLTTSTACCFLLVFLSFSGNS